MDGYESDIDMDELSFHLQELVNLFGNMRPSKDNQTDFVHIMANIYKELKMCD